MIRAALIAVLLFSPLFESEVFAWGCQGHQIVAYIAEHNLNKAATKNVRDLLSDAQGQYVDSRGEEIKRWCSDTELGPIEYFSTWADDIRSPENADWHFWDVPLAQSSASYPGYCEGKGCVISALDAQLRVLRSSSASRNEKQRALLFVIHFVGDLHQPMHIVDNGDRGGNCVPVNFQYRGYSKSTEEKKDHGKGTGSFSPNLHSIWDTEMIAVFSGHKKEADQDEATSNMADKLLAGNRSQISAETKNRIDLDSGINLFVSWALSTHAVARTAGYEKMPTEIPVDPSPQTLSGCKGVSDRFLSLGEVANQAYVNNAQPAVEKQLALAGARLAALLNSVWPQ